MKIQQNKIWRIKWSREAGAQIKLLGIRVEEIVFSRILPVIAENPFGSNFTQYRGRVFHSYTCPGVKTTEIKVFFTVADLSYIIIHRVFLITDSAID